MRRVILAAVILGLLELGSGLLSAREPLAIPRPERTAPAVTGRSRDDGLWRRHLDLVERELERGRIDVAVRLWHDAHGAAIASRTWESMLALGDAWLAIGRAAGTPRGARERARDAYTTALIRTRRVRSVDGVIGSAEGFRRLDEHVFAEQSLRIAEQVAEGDGAALERVREVRQRWAAPVTITEF
jgi:hypothetical protein